MSSGIRDLGCLRDKCSSRLIIITEVSWFMLTFKIFFFFIWRFESYTFFLSGLHDLWQACQVLVDAFPLQDRTAGSRTESEIARLEVQA